ncbi:MAG: alpha/beta fold hydrolase [Phycisphaeraceae bacterium]|nr:alpha/beta fold hydrolase [Phycisphaerales bacterium]MCB9843397.1 alpha/beta fold hydrolase [Phycisphaeraceae bacterium]
MRVTHTLGILAVLLLAALASAQSSLRNYNIPYASDFPFAGKFVGGVSIPSISKHGFANLDITRDDKNRVDVILTLAPFGMFRYRCTDPQVAGDILRFKLPPPPGAETAECELRITPDAQRVEGMIRYYPEMREQPPARIVAARRPDVLEMPTLYSWTGVIDQDQAPLDVTLRVGSRPDGLVVGEFDIPEHQLFAATLGDLQYEPDIDLLVASIPEKITGMLDLQISSNGKTLDGTYTRERKVSPASFQQDARIVSYRSFINEGGGTSFGELTMPVGPGPFPCIVILGTFGLNDRDGIGPTTGAHKPYQDLARTLNDRGYAVYRYDDRGTGYTRDSAPPRTLGSVAADAANALSLIAATPRIDPSRVILLGHGEGGQIAPMLLSRNPSPAGLILVNAPVGNGVDFLIEQTQAEMRVKGRDQSRIDVRSNYVGVFLDAVVRGDSDEQLAGIVRSNIVSLRQMISDEKALQSLPSIDDAIKQDMASMANPWIRSVAAWDNGPALAAAKVPVLALFASLDTQVPPGSASARAKQAFATGGVTDASVQILDGLNHFMQRAVSGSTDEYADPNRTPFDKASTDAILAWLDAHFPSK